MTDGNLGQNQAPLDAAHTHVSSNAPQERLLNSEQVNFLVSKEKAEAFERGKQAAMAQVPQGVSEDRIAEIASKMAEEKLKAIQDQYAVNQIVGTHRQNVAAGQQEYGEDFTKAVSKINFGATPGLIPLLNSLPNAKDVMFELGKDAKRFATIHSLVAGGQGAMAEELVREISESIKTNQKKLAEKKPDIKEPIPQLKPSTASVDSGQTSLRDLKAMLKR